VSKSSRGIVFLAWGSPAQKRIDSIGVDKTKHCILRTVHPSPLSASRGFFDCKHFIKANEWLRNRYGVEGEVEWDCLADNKKNRGLPAKSGVVEEKFHDGVIPPSAKGVVEKSAQNETPVAAIGKTSTGVTESDEYDDDELDKLLSSQ